MSNLKNNDFKPKDFKPLMTYLINNPRGTSVKINFDEIAQTDDKQYGDDKYTCYHFEHEGFYNPYKPKNVVGLCNENSNNITKNLKIIIKTKSDNTSSIVAQSFGYTPTFIYEDNMNMDLTNAEIYPYNEVTVLRFWYIGSDLTEESQPASMFGSGWMISTSNKINGFSTKLNSKRYVADVIDESFGDYFNKLISNKNLNKKACYVFLLKSKDTEIVNYDDNKTELIYTGSYIFNENSTDMFMTFYKNYDIDNVIMPECENVLSQTPITIDEMSELNYKSGYVVYLPDGTNIKLLYKNYNDKIILRNNNRNWKHWWYLQTWSGDNPSFKIVPTDQLQNIMPQEEYNKIEEYKKEFEEQRIKSLAILMNEYIFRLINRRPNVKLTIDEEWILSETKRQYYNDKNEYKMNNGKFYWGGDPYNVNAYILFRMNNIWNNIRGDRLYRLVKNTKEKTNIKIYKDDNWEIYKDDNWKMGD